MTTKCCDGLIMLYFYMSYKSNSDFVSSHLTTIMYTPAVALLTSDDRHHMCTYQSQHKTSVVKCTPGVYYLPILVAVQIQTRCFKSNPYFTRRSMHRQTRKVGQAAAHGSHLEVQRSQQYEVVDCDARAVTMSFKDSSAHECDARDNEALQEALQTVCLRFPTQHL